MKLLRAGSLCFTALVWVLAPLTVLSADTDKILGPSGEVLIAPSANNLEQIESPQLAPAPGASSSQVQADCLMESGTFYGSDFLSTKHSTASSPSDCCAACKNAADCTVWNWCGDKAGCPLPPNLATASGSASVDFQTCIWKPRPLTYAGTLPEPPLANNSQAFQGWTSGIPINGTLLPALQGFEMTPGIEMEYSEDTDFFCTGSSTSKPVCQLYGNAKGGALACLNNPICRGFQICWAFPTASDFYSQAGIIRMKAGAQSPLNISTALQNPYCSVYVLKAGSASTNSSGDSGYSLRGTNNITAVSAAASKIGKRLLQAPAANNFTKTSNVGTGGSSINGIDRPNVINIAPTQSISPSTEPSSATTRVPAPAPSTSRGGTTFTTPFLDGDFLQAFDNITFNYTQCYSDAPTIHVTLQAQQFPLQGPTKAYSIHTWTEVPFRNSGDVCCAFKDEADFFLNLETGVLAKTIPVFVATDATLTSGPPLKNYDTTPASIASPLVYVPAGQMSNPSAGQGRQFTFPRTNSSDYITALEQIYFSLAQVALGNHFCTPGTPQLEAAVNFVGDLLSELTEDGEENSSGIPDDLLFVAANAPNPDGSSENASCLVEEGALYEVIHEAVRKASTASPLHFRRPLFGIQGMFSAGYSKAVRWCLSTAIMSQGIGNVGRTNCIPIRESRVKLYLGEVLKTLSTGSGTAEACCKACWLFYDIETNAACDLWSLNTQNGSCQLKNSTLAAEFQAVPAQRGSEFRSYTSGRRTAVMPASSENLFALANL